MGIGENRCSGVVVDPEEALLGASGPPRSSPRIVSARLTETIPGANTTVLTVPTFGTLEATCAPTGFGLLWRDRTNPSTALDVWVVEEGGTTRFVTQATANVATQIALDVKGDEMFTEQVGRPAHTATITTAGHWSPTGCVFHAQAISQ